MPGWTGRRQGCCTCSRTKRMRYPGRDLAARTGRVSWVDSGLSAVSLYPFLQSIRGTRSWTGIGPQWCGRSSDCWRSAAGSNRDLSNAGFHAFFACSVSFLPRLPSDCFGKACPAWVVRTSPFQDSGSIHPVIPDLRISGRFPPESVADILRNRWTI